MRYRKIYGYRIKRARQLRGMSRRELATALDCHWGRIVDLENEQAEPTDSEVFALVQVLGFPLDHFTNHEKSPALVGGSFEAHALGDMDEEAKDDFINGL